MKSDTFVQLIYEQNRDSFAEICAREGQLVFMGDNSLNYACKPGPIQSYENLLSFFLGKVLVIVSNIALFPMEYDKLGMSQCNKLDKVPCLI